MVNDILNKNYNPTINSGDFLYSKELTEADVDRIVRISNERQTSTYLTEKESSKKKTKISPSKKKSSTKSTTRERPKTSERKTKRARVSGGMWRHGAPAGGPPAGDPPAGDLRVNVNLRAQTEAESNTFDATNDIRNQNNLNILQNAYAINYNYRFPDDARPIGTLRDFRPDSIVSASSQNGVNINTNAPNARDARNAVACVQWFDTIWRSVVNARDANDFADFNTHSRPTYTTRINLDSHGAPGDRRPARDDFGYRVRQLANLLGVAVPPIAPRNRDSVNIVYSCHEFQGRNRAYPEHRTYRILFIVSRDIHFTLYCHRFAGGNIEFVSPHFTFQPRDPRAADPNRAPLLENYHLYANARMFLEGFNRNAVRNPIIALSILAHYISKTAYLLLFTTYALENHNINQDYQVISNAMLQYRPDRYDFIELGHYAGGLHTVILDHFQTQFSRQIFPWFYVHQERNEFYINEYREWLTELIVTGRAAPGAGCGDNGPPHGHLAGFFLTRFPADNLAIFSHGLGGRARGIWTYNERTTAYPPYTAAAEHRWGPASTLPPPPPHRAPGPGQLPRRPPQRGWPRWSDSFDPPSPRRRPMGAASAMGSARPMGAASAMGAASGSPWGSRQLGVGSSPATEDASAMGDTSPMGAASGDWRRRDPAGNPNPRGGPPQNSRGIKKSSKKKKGGSDNTSGGALLNISTNKTLIKYLNKEKELKIDIKLLKKDKNKNKKKIIKKTDLLKKLKLKIIDKKEKLKKQKQKQKEKLKKKGK